MFTTTNTEIALTKLIASAIAVAFLLAVVL